MLRGGSFAAVCPRPGRRRKHTFSWGACGRNPTVFSQFLQTDSTRNQKNVRIMAFFKEFKEFALKGNVMDMAVGVIIGGAFGKIVSSLVNDIIMPPVGALLGNTDFSHLRIDLSRIRDLSSQATHVVADTLTQGAGTSVVKTAEAAEPVWWNYGAFIQQCVDFTILAFCIFMMVKLMNRMVRKKEAAPAPPPPPTKEELLLTEIRDLLKNRKRD